MLSLVVPEDFRSMSLGRLRHEGVLLWPIAQPTNYKLCTTTCGTMPNNPFHLVVGFSTYQYRWWQAAVPNALVQCELGDVEHRVQLGEPPSQAQPIEDVSHTRIDNKGTNKTLTKLR